MIKNQWRLCVFHPGSSCLLASRCSQRFLALWLVGWWHTVLLNLSDWCWTISFNQPYHDAVNTQYRQFKETKSGKGLHFEMSDVSLTGSRYWPHASRCRPVFWMIVNEQLVQFLTYSPAVNAKEEQEEDKKWQQYSLFSENKNHFRFPWR